MAARGGRIAPWIGFATILALSSAPGTPGTGLDDTASPPLLDTGHTGPAFSPSLDGTPTNQSQSNSCFPDCVDGG